PALSREAGGLVPPHRESELSLDGRALGAAAARHDHPFLPGMVSDVVHRSAAVSGVHVFDFQFLPGLAARAVPEKLAASLALSAISYGAGHRSDHYQHPRRAGSSDWEEVGLCAHAQVSGGIES